MGLFRNLWRGRKPERREPVSRDYEREARDRERDDEDERGQGRHFAPEEPPPRFRGRNGRDYATPRERAAYGYAGEDDAGLYYGGPEPDEPPRPQRRVDLRWEESDPVLMHDRRRLAESERGHRGRGPRGYRRSDERILEDICDRLTEDPLIDATDIEVTVRNSEAVLDGTVTDKLTRRRAEDIADCVSGVVVVINNLRIERRPALRGESNAPTN